jgi:hypothetical protein
LSYSENNLQTIFSIENELKIALEAIESNWRDSFFSGLIDCLLSNWETKHQKSLEQLEQFITKKLDDYSGNRSTLISFKNNKLYFNTKNGNEILGLTLARMNSPIQEATKILGVPESWFSYSYFSRVIVAYYERNKIDIYDNIDSIDEILNKHNRLNTNRLLIPKLVIQASEPNFYSLRDKAKKIALSHLKDPQNIGESLWYSNTDDISVIEKTNIQKKTFELSYKKKISAKAEIIGIIAAAITKIKLILKFSFFSLGFFANYISCIADLNINST